MGGNQELIICLLIGARTHTEPPDTPSCNQLVPTQVHTAVGTGHSSTARTGRSLFYPAPRTV